jgi:hypothetical protein
MREIKFRAWLGDGEDSGIYFSPNLVEIGHGFARCDGDEYDLSGEPGNFVVLEQYTGLKDKNGREIFEGDVLETSDSEDPCYEIVEWGTQEWKPNNIPLCDTLVVGNIHEGEYKKEATE